MSSNLIRRLGVAAAIAGSTLAGVVVASGTADAAPPVRCQLYGMIYPGAGTVEAELWQECQPYPEYRPLTAKILKLDWNTGDWHEVAAGRPHATYYCAGTASTWYRISGTDEYLAADCG